MVQRSRYWCFTLNNPEEEPQTFLEHVQGVSHFKYCTFQLEIGEAGTPHFQGYLEFHQVKRLDWLKRHVSQRANFGVRRGTAEQAREYARKDDTRHDGPWEAGTWDPIKVGQRTDIQNGVEAVASGGLDRLVEQAPELFVKYHRGFSALATHYGGKRKRDYEQVTVKLSYGVPGCGKTRSVVEEWSENDLYVHEPGSPWFDGYTGQDCLLLDDFAGASSGIRLDKALVMLDKYKARLPVKGGHTYLVSTTIWVTTNIHPIYWYKWTGREVHYKALARRFDEVHIWEGNQRVLLGELAAKQFWDTDEMEPYGTTWGDITVPMPRADGY